MFCCSVFLPRLLLMGHMPNLIGRPPEGRGCCHLHVCGLLASSCCRAGVLRVPWDFTASSREQVLIRTALAVCHTSTWRGRGAREPAFPCFGQVCLTAHKEPPARHLTACLYPGCLSPQHRVARSLCDSAASPSALRHAAHGSIWLRVWFVCLL